jgi:cell division protein FtsW
MSEATQIEEATRSLKEPIAEPVPEAPAYHVDPVLLALVLSLTAFGIVMVYSASAVYATQKFGYPTYFLRRDLIWSAMGLGVMWWAAKTDFSAYRKYAYPILGIAIMLLAAVLVVGARINGARRWFHLGPISFQPAELAKLALVLYLASSLARKAEKVKSFTVGFVPHMVVCGLMMALLLKQPDLGTACILGMTTLVMLFVAGAKISYIFIAVLAAAPVIYQAIVGTPWRMRRMLAYLDPLPYRYDVGYQIYESIISIGSGGLWGLGLGDGRQKMGYVPELQTDYLPAIIAEELGFIGMCVLLITFGVLVWRGARAALKARDPFGCYLGFGITAMFGLQAVVNLGVVMGALPSKGLPLPFVSFGGSTLVVDLLAMGILLNISRGAPEPARPSVAPPVKRTSGARRLPGGGRRVTVEV